MMLVCMGGRLKEWRKQVFTDLSAYKQYAYVSLSQELEFYLHYRNINREPTET